MTAFRNCRIITIIYDNKDGIIPVTKGQNNGKEVGMSYLTLENVGKEYTVGSVNVKALNHVTFSLDNGEFIVILGSSGAGKTTLLNLLGGMDGATEGHIELEGQDLTALDQRGLCDYRRNDVGFVFQFYNLMPNLTALENVEIAAEICKDHTDPGAALREVGLEDRMNHFPAQLSGGEQQRVSIARAVAKNPKLLLCDEPTGALDDATGRKILRLLSDVCKRQNKLVIVVTHNAAIKDMADRVIYLKNGEVDRVERNAHPLPVESIAW